MDTSFEDQIRERAYHIWLATGMAEGMAHEHWTCAEQAVLGETRAPDHAAEPVIIMTKAAAKPAKSHKAGAKASPVKAKSASKSAGKSAPQMTGKTAPAAH